MIHVVGLDMSLTGFGVARIRVDEDSNGLPDIKLSRHGRDGSRTETLTMRRERIRTLAAQVYAAALDGYDPAGDRMPVFIIESPTYSTSVSGNQHDRSGLWWVLLNILFKVGIVVEAPISAAKQYATGRGRFRKEEGKTPTIVAVNDMFGGAVPTITDDNLADALVLGAMAARQIGHPIEVSPQRCHPGALAAVHWPDTIRQFDRTL